MGEIAEGDGDTLFNVCAELRHEGVVAKRLGAPYPPTPPARHLFWPALACAMVGGENGAVAREDLRALRIAMYGALSRAFAVLLGSGMFRVIDGGLVGSDLDWTHYPADT